MPISWKWSNIHFTLTPRGYCLISPPPFFLLLCIGKDNNKAQGEMLSMVQQQQQPQYWSASNQWMEGLCVVYHERPVKPQQWPCTKPSHCLGSTCGQDTIVASVSGERRAWSSHPLNLSLFFSFYYYYRRQLMWKRTGVAPQLPNVTLIKTVPWLSDFKTGLLDLSRRARTSSLLAQSFLFSLGVSFGLTWPAGVRRYYCSVLIKPNAESQEPQSGWQRPRFTLTDALHTSSQCYVPPIYTAILVHLQLFMSRGYLRKMSLVFCAKLVFSSSSFFR